jgi:ABC-type oligopeptide transport system ATPase subunit
MTKNGNLVEVRGLKKYFPTGPGLLGAGTDVVKAVDDVSFAIRRG